MANSTYNIVLRNGGDIKQKYNLVFYNAQQTSGRFTIHEPPSYRSVYITDAKIDGKNRYWTVTAAYLF